MDLFTSTSSWRRWLLLNYDHIDSSVILICVLLICWQDFAVDGLVNHISEFNAVVESEGEHNPSNNAFYYEETPLDSEQKVCTSICVSVILRYITIPRGVMMKLWHCAGYSRLQSGDWSLLEDLQPACQELYRTAHGLQVSSGFQGVATGGS